MRISNPRIQLSCSLVFLSASLAPEAHAEVTWTSCANEGQICTLSGPMSIRYGANVTFATKTMTGAVPCSNAVFGDPAPGVAKHCETSPLVWTFCANEGQVCNYSGKMNVRYGANTTFITKSLSGPVSCSNTVFGDPTPGVAKHCEFSEIPITALTITPNSVALVTGSQQVFSAAGGVAPYVFSATSGTIANSGNSTTFTAPSAPGTITVTVADSSGQKPTARINVVSRLQVNQSSAPLNVGSTFAVVAQGGLAPYSYSLSGVGSLSGTTYSAGTTTGSATVVVKDALGQSAPINLTVVVSALGTGVASGNMPNCTPVVSTDFMDSVPWEVRYVEPRDCSIVRLSTPVFSWTLPSDWNSATPMKLNLRRPLDTFILSRDVTTPRLLLSDVSLPSGQYEWYVSYTNKSGTVVNSQVRRFVIPNEPGLLALPGGVSFANIVANKSHPRALPSGSDFASIAVKAQTGEYKEAYGAFLQKANSLLTAPIPAVPVELTRSDFASDLDYYHWQMSLMHQATDEQTAIETLAYAGRFTGNSSFDSAAIARLLSLAAWSTSGATSEATQDQANRAIYLALGMGLDLFQTKLSSSQRQTIVTSLKDRLNQAMVKYPGFDKVPHDSHLVTATFYTTESLMYAVGTPEFPEANDLLAKSWDVYVTMLEAWGGSYDGGFGNSEGYGWVRLGSVARMGAALKLMANLDLTRLPAIGNFGDNQIALMAAAGGIRGQFGDGVENNQYFANYWPDYRLYASVTGKPAHEWFWRTNPSNVSTAFPLQPMHYLLLGLRIPSAPTTTPTLPHSWVFEDVGIAALHTNSTDPLRSSVYFRSSRFGSYNHSQADNNAFTFVSKGKDLLISGGYYPYYLSPHHALVGRATRFKNALTFDGGIGQAEPTATPTVPGAPILSMDTRGLLINFGENGAWAFTTGDATLAYRGQDPSTRAFTPLLSNAIRSVAYNRQAGIMVIYDWATSDTARKWELNFQSLQQPTLQGQTVHVTNSGVEACIDIYGAPGTFALTSGFPIAPENGLPNQFQTRYSASTSSRQLVSVTVVREDCSSNLVSVSFSNTSASVRINGGPPLVFDRKTIQSY